MNNLFSGCYVSLDTAIKCLLQRGPRDVPHDTLEDADFCRKVSEHGAKRLGHFSFKEYIEENPHKKIRFDDLDASGRVFNLKSELVFFSSYL